MIKICCPSYRRSKRPKTFARYPDAVYYIDESDEGAYRSYGVDYVVVPGGVQGNVSRIRNYVLDLELQKGADGVVFMDDDISWVAVFEPKPNNGKGWDARKLNQDELWQVIEDGFRLCEDWGFKMWGINPGGAMRRSYKRNQPFSTTNYIASPFVGFLPNPLRYDESIPLKEDYDMTLQHARRFGGSLRMNMLHVICDQGCKGSAKAGGCSTYRTTAEERRQFDALQAKWGSRLVKRDRTSKLANDYNPIIHVPIQGL